MPQFEMILRDQRVTIDATISVFQPDKGRFGVDVTIRDARTGKTCEWTLDRAELARVCREAARHPPQKK